MVWGETKWVTTSGLCEKVQVTAGKDKTRVSTIIATDYRRNMVKVKVRATKHAGSVKYKKYGS
eukprot:4076914-Amphidinium_carterae.1